MKAQAQIPTVGERARQARLDLNLLIAGLSMDPDDMPNEVDDVELRESLLAVAQRAYNEVFWLTELPPNVAAQPAPDNDQRDEMERNHGNA